MVRGIKQHLPAGIEEVVVPIEAGVDHPVPVITIAYPGDPDVLHAVIGVEDEKNLIVAGTFSFLTVELIAQGTGFGGVPGRSFEVISEPGDVRNIISVGVLS